MLTKARLAQLLFMLAVLLVLFFSKTFGFFEQKEANQEEVKISEKPNFSLLSCDYQSACEFVTDQGTFLLSIKNLPIKAEEWIDFELSMPDKNSTVTKAQIVGKSMFMGRIPVTFKQSQPQRFIAKSMVGACTTAQMIWSLEITVKAQDVEELLVFDFMVLR